MMPDACHVAPALLDFLLGADKAAILLISWQIAIPKGPPHPWQGLVHK
jgi:hypothetical protein